MKPNKLVQISRPEVFELQGTNKQGLNANAAEEKMLQVGLIELQKGKKKNIRVKGIPTTWVLPKCRLTEAVFQLL